jgi:hypothetical protein
MQARGRETPVTFSATETAEIRRVAATPDGPLLCPRCGGDLEVGEERARDTLHPVWEVRCEACRRNGYVTKLAKQRRPKKGG